MALSPSYAIWSPPHSQLPTTLGSNAVKDMHIVDRVILCPSPLQSLSSDELKCLSHMELLAKSLEMQAQQIQQTALFCGPTARLIYAGWAWLPTAPAGRRPFGTLCSSRDDQAFYPHLRVALATGVCGSQQASAAFEIAVVKCMMLCVRSLIEMLARKHVHIIL